jgi:hypothetical protein
MSYDFSGFSDYVQRETKPLTKTLFAGGDTAKFARFMNGVKGSTEVPKITGKATLQPGFCKNPVGDTTVGVVTIKVNPYTFHEAFCEDELQEKLPNTVLAPGSTNEGGVVTDSDWRGVIIETKVSSINEALELLYWRGDTLSGDPDLTLFDGFLKLIDAAGDAVDGNPDNLASITLANVRGIIEGQYDLAPALVQRAKINGKSDFAIAAGDDTFNLYISALKDANLYHYAPEHTDGMFTLPGGKGTLYKVYGLDGTNRIISGRGSNLIVGNDIPNEEEVMEVWYSKDDGELRLRSKAKAGVQVDNTNEFVEFHVGA